MSTQERGRPFSTPIYVFGQRVGVPFVPLQSTLRGVHGRGIHSPPSSSAGVHLRVRWLCGRGCPIDRMEGHEDFEPQLVDGEIVEDNHDDNDVGVGDDGDDDDDDDDDDDVDVEERLADRLRELSRNEVRDYDSLVSLLVELRSAGMLDEVRQVREMLAKNFALSPSLWLEWIEDEKMLDSSGERVSLLFKRATDEGFRSAVLWSQRLNFEMLRNRIDSASMVAICHAALAECSLDVGSGLELWRLCLSVYSATSGSALQQSVISANLRKHP